MGAEDQIGEIYNFGSFKIVSALRIGTGRAFNKAGPDTEIAVDPVLVFIRGTTNLFEFVERRYFEHFGQTSQADMQVSCLLVFKKLLCIL